MQHSISHWTTSRIALAVALATAATSLLLASVASASSEATAEDAVAVAVSSIPTEEIESQAPESSGADKAPSAPAEPAVEPPEAEAIVAEPVRAVTSSADRVAEAAASAVVPSTSTLVASSNPSTDLPHAELLHEAMQSVSVDPKSLMRIEPALTKLSREAREAANEALGRGSADHLAPIDNGGAENNGLGPAGVGATPLPQQMAGGHPAPSLADVRLLNERATVVDGLLATQHLTVLGDVEPSQLVLSSAGGEHASAGTKLLPAAGAAPLNEAGGRSGGMEPPDGEVPPSPPGSPQSTASGSGGSSFIPIVGLLALLALAAPAIFRRPTGGPVFRAPVPFVCALERPG